MELDLLVAEREGTAVLDQHRKRVLCGEFVVGPLDLAGFSSIWEIAGGAPGVGRAHYQPGAKRGKALLKRQR